MLNRRSRSAIKISTKVRFEPIVTYSANIRPDRLEAVLLNIANLERKLSRQYQLDEETPSPFRKNKILEYHYKLITAKGRLAVIKNKAQ